MIILDTNVLSSLMRQTPEPQVVDWLNKQPRTSVWTTAITVFEVRFGLRAMPTGRRQSALMRSFEEVLGDLNDRVLPFDFEAATLTGDIAAARRKSGRSADLRDTVVAGIVLAHHGTLATRNTAHFDDLSISLVNPWTS